jgi:hypothetical protein
MDYIWDSQINSSFSKFKNTDTDLIRAFQKLELEYSNASGQFTIGNTLVDLMNQQQDVGGLNYKNNLPLISKSQGGDNKAIEEIEFTYLYYLMCNKAVLMWAAFGRKGFNQVDAIAQVTGAVVEYDKTIAYGHIISLLGQLGVSQSINNLYSPLSNLH